MTRFARRTFVRMVLGSAAAMVLADPRRACAARIGDPIDEALLAAGRFLAERQSPDGGWRSATYGGLRDGFALTGPAGKVVLELAPFDPVLRRAGERALDRLVHSAPGPGASVLDYPVYTAAMAAIALARHGRSDDDRAARDAWLAQLRRQQLDESLGWSEADVDYGGFGYSPRPPRRPDDGDASRLPFASDLSSTTFAVGALAIAGGPEDAARLAKANRFVERCQNWPHGDGGFFVSVSNPVQNKAGDFRSYGSATADGIRCLLRFGAGPDDPRLVAAAEWLRAHLPTETNPGDFIELRRAEQDGGAFYFAWSAGHALRGLRHALAEPWIDDAATALADGLLARQRADGSWRNPNPFMREDDPVVATALAAGALGASRG
ncbi:MAG: terpene cyclase/mutase family protein [Phycisphaerales bacterium]|nr:terpene cyclase/mutase family protein [Phycisphaerales bacterium]